MILRRYGAQRARGTYSCSKGIAPQELGHGETRTTARAMTRQGGSRTSRFQEAARGRSGGVKIRSLEVIFPALSRAEEGRE